MFPLKERKKVGLTVCESVVSSQLGTRLLKVEKILKGVAKHDSSQKVDVFYSKKSLRQSGMYKNLHRMLYHEA